MHHYFKKRETQCKCGCGKNISDDFLIKLNQVRQRLDKPMKINSGARCTVHNRKVKGSPTSQHLLGIAVDVACPSGAYAVELTKLALDWGMTVGVYSNFLHIDDRDIQTLFRGPY